MMFTEAVCMAGSPGAMVCLHRAQASRVMVVCILQPSFPYERVFLKRSGKAKAPQVEGTNGASWVRLGEVSRLCCDVGDLAAVQVQGDDGGLELLPVDLLLGAVLHHDHLLRGAALDQDAPPLGLEREAVLAETGDRIWNPTRVSAAVDLRYVIDRAESGERLPEEAEPLRASTPDDIPDRGAASDIADHLLPVFLKPALDLISDWPWIALWELAGLLGVSPQRASQLVIPLERFGLAAGVPESSRRLALTDRGLSLLARRDRTSAGVAKLRWSIAPKDPEGPFEWRNVTGRKGRQLLRNIEHTAAVHGFLAALTTQAPLLGWEIVQLDPPRRASRHFRHDDRMRAVNPDACGVLRKGGAEWAFFLEWARRAVRPSTM